MRKKNEKNYSLYDQFRIPSIDSCRWFMFSCVTEFAFTQNWLLGFAFFYWSYFIECFRSFARLCKGSIPIDIILLYNFCISIRDGETCFWIDIWRRILALDRLSCRLSLLWPRKFFHRRSFVKWNFSLQQPSKISFLKLLIILKCFHERHCLFRGIFKINN